MAQSSIYKWSNSNYFPQSSCDITSLSFKIPSALFPNDYDQVLVKREKAHTIQMFCEKCSQCFSKLICISKKSQCGNCIGKGKRKRFRKKQYLFLKTKKPRLKNWKLQTQTLFTAWPIRKAESNNHSLDGLLHTSLALVKEDGRPTLKEILSRELWLWKKNDHLLDSSSSTDCLGYYAGNYKGIWNSTSRS